MSVKDTSLDERTKQRFRAFLKIESRAGQPLITSSERELLEAWLDGCDDPDNREALEQLIATLSARQGLIS